MRARLSRTPFPSQKLEPDNAFQVMIVYEDYAVGRSAMDTYQRLISRFGRELDFRINLWSFEILQSAPADSAAVHAAVDADAIIVATHQRDDLPLPIKEWVQAWVPLKQEQTAVLIALFDFTVEPSGASPTFDYLKNAAAGAGMDFLVQQAQPASNGPLSSRVFNEPGSQPAPEGWGLND